MGSWRAADHAKAVLGAEAQMRRANSFWKSHKEVRHRARVLRVLEKSRRFLFRQELSRLDGPRAPVLRMLERVADEAHDKRLFTMDNLRTLARSARGAEMQATVLYEESDGRR